MGEHAKLSPSSAHRWLTCPASAEAASRTVSPDTEHSLAGTAGHWAYAVWLQTGTPPPVGSKAPNGVEITTEMLEMVGSAVGWVQGYIARAGGPCSLMVEERVQIGAPFFGLNEDWLWGTADTIIMAPTELVVFDLKLGYVDVPVEDNEQLTMYAIGVCEELGWLWNQIRFVILQPKNGGPKEWPITKSQLIATGNKWKPKVLEATKPNARFNPEEEACRYCPAAGVCKALQTNAIEIAKREFDSPAAIVENISREELGLILAKADLVEVAIKAAREHAKKLIQLGQEVPGWKVVEGKKNRVWRAGTEASVASLMRAVALSPYKEPELISPAQAEKMMKGFTTASELEKFIEKPKGEPVLAPITDRRPALAANFDVIDVGNLLD